MSAGWLLCFCGCFVDVELRLGPAMLLIKCACMASNAFVSSTTSLFSASGFRLQTTSTVRSHGGLPPGVGGRLSHFTGKRVGINDKSDTEKVDKDVDGA